MRVIIAAIGKLPAGPERELIDTYIARTDAISGVTRLGPVEVAEINPKPAERTPAAEARLLDAALRDAAPRIALDERGVTLGSAAFAKRLEAWRDDGARRLGFVIGGADGLDPDLGAGADFRLSLGAMTWPHALARVMLTEQLYRAASILAGGPYHREGAPSGRKRR